MPPGDEVEASGMDDHELRLNRYTRLQKMFPEWNGEKFVSLGEPHRSETTILYGELLTEALQRCAIVRHFIGEKQKLHAQYAAEICYLQFRYICELIALACMSAHGDTAEVRSKKLQDAYQADIIIKTMSKINSAFYPMPIKRVPNNKSNKVISEIQDDVPHLTKDDLLNLYRSSSKFLHIGSFSALVDEREDYSRGSVRAWVEKVETLLDDHIIRTANMDHVIFNSVTRYPNGKIHLQLTGIARITFQDEGV